MQLSAVIVSSSPSSCCHVLRRFSAAPFCSHLVSTWLHFMSIDQRGWRKGLRTFTRTHLAVFGDDCEVHLQPLSLVTTSRHVFVVKPLAEPPRGNHISSEVIDSGSDKVVPLEAEADTPWQHDTYLAQWQPAEGKRPSLYGASSAKRRQLEMEPARVSQDLAPSLEDTLHSDFVVPSSRGTEASSQFEAVP